MRFAVNAKWSFSTLYFFEPDFFKNIYQRKGFLNIIHEVFCFSDLSSLGGVTDATRVLPETSNPLFLSHGNLAISLGLGGQPHQMAHANSLARNLASVAPGTQANSASNLATMFPSITNRNSLHNNYYPPLGPSTISGSVDAPGFATGMGGPIRPANSLRTFLNEKGDDSGIDEDGDQSPPPEERGNRVQTSSLANPGTSAAAPGGVNADNQRANILKEELRKHMSKYFLS